jgi:hypothetical protein
MEVEGVGGNGEGREKAEGGDGFSSDIETCCFFHVGVSIWNRLVF